MRVDNANFTLKNTAANKDPRYTIELAFDFANTDLHYLTSHADTQVPLNASVTKRVIHKNGISSTSQIINPDLGLATIGTITLKVLDDNELISTLLNTKLDIGSGLRGKRIRIYTSFEGEVWADYVLIQTQIIETVSFQNGYYTIKCADIQRSERKNIFDLVSTNLSQSITELDLKIPVYDNSKFERLAHGSSYTDAPNKTVLYLKIDKEIIRCSGIATDPVLGLVFIVDVDGRGALNTVKTAHVIDNNLTDDSRKTKVKEYVYLEMPVPKLIYAILTGNLEGQPGKTLPRKWHLGLSLDFVRLDDFTTIGSDLWDTTNDLFGVLGVFQGIKKQDAKKFIEKELNLLIGCYNPIYSDGALGLKRMTAVLSSSGTILELNESNVISFGAVEHDMRSVRNTYQIDWNYDELRGKPTRSTLLIDPASITKHGEAALKVLKFRGLDGRRHTQATLFNLFNSLRDRYAAPPIKLKLKCLPSLNVLEVGDVVRVNLNNARDFNGTLKPLDRPFEIQGISLNWLTGSVDLTLFASSQAAGALALSAATSVLNDAFYTQIGIDLKAYLNTNYPGSFTELNGVGTIGADVTLTGGSPTSMVYFYDGALTIANATTMTITKTVELRCKGHLQINGKIDGKGQGLPGVTAISEFPPATTGSVGYIGYTKAGGGVQINEKLFFDISLVQATGTSITSVTADSKRSELTNISLVNNKTTNTLRHVPTDLQGCSGGGGGAINYINIEALGGNGGNGGAGLVTISRGVSFGGSGLVDLSGSDGFAGSKTNASGIFNGDISVYGGGGAGGSGGAWLTLLDGTSVSSPDSSNVKTEQGLSPVTGSPLGVGNVIWEHGDVVTSHFLGFGKYTDPKPFHRVQYIPPDIIPVADAPLQTVIPPTNLNLRSGDSELLLSSDGTVISRIKASWTASVDQHLGGYEVEYKLSTDVNWTPASNTINLEILSVYIAPVQDGINYDVRVRAINTMTIASEWLSILSYSVIGKKSRPKDVDNFLVQRQPDGTRTFDGGLLTSNRPVDFSGYEIRAALGSGLSWEELTPLHNGVITQLPFETNQLAAGSYTAGIKAIDTSGNESVNAKIVESTLGDPRISNALVIVDFRAQGFTGIKTNAWIDFGSGNLVATSLNDWSGLPNTWAQWTQWAHTFNTTCSYEHDVIDIGVITNVTPLVSVTSNATSIVIEESHSNDSLTFTPFAIAGNQINARYIKIKISVTNATVLPEITQALVIFDADIVEEQLENIDTALITGAYRIGVGDIRLPIIKKYSQIKTIQIALQNVGAGWSWEIIDKDTTLAPRIKIYNASNVLADAIIDAIIIGA